MRKAKSTSVEEPCSRKEKLAKATGVPVRVAEIATIYVKDDDDAKELLERIKVVRDRLTPEEQAKILKLGILERMTFLKKKIGEQDANLVGYSDIICSYTLAKFFSS